MRSSIFKAIAASAFAVMAATSAASAADIAARPYTKAPPVMVEVWNWTGFYIGGNVGYSWGRSSRRYLFRQLTSGAGIVPPAGSIAAPAANMNGVIGGGQIGYNWQSSAIGCGVLKPTSSGSDEKGRGDFLCAATRSVRPLPSADLTVLARGPRPVPASRFDQKLEWFGTVRGRVGVLATPQGAVLCHRRSGLWPKSRPSATMPVRRRRCCDRFNRLHDTRRWLHGRRWRRRRDRRQLDRQARIPLHGSGQDVRIGS